MSGILRPNAGEVRVEGTSTWRLGADQLAAFHLRTIGFVFQDYHLFPRLTTVENVAIPLVLRRRPWREAVAEAAGYLEVVGPAGCAGLPPVKLSGGEQQRVAVARAIVAQPDVLILDEPTASLDGNTGRKIMAFVRERVLTERRSILVVTHDARILEYADRVMHMEDGRITGFGKESL